MHALAGDVAEEGAEVDGVGGRPREDELAGEARVGEVRVSYEEERMRRRRRGGERIRRGGPYHICGRAKSTSDKGTR